MAEIPVERKTGGGLPWWLIPLLLLLLLIPLLFLFSRGCNDTAGVVGNANNGNANRAAATTATNAAPVAVTNTTVANTNTTVANPATTAAVTDVSFYGGVNDKNTLVGRRVDFDNVPVTRVLSDRVFTVGTGAGEQFALLSENLDTGGGKEQQIKMRPGQRVNLEGDFRRVPDAESQEERGRQLNQKEYAEMKGQQIYLHVTKVEDAR